MVAPMIARYADLAGKVAVVTGASRGIGAATARALAENGARVALVGRDEAALAAVTDGIRAGGGEALALRADCTVDGEVDAMTGEVSAQLGPPDILVAFAGGGGMPVATAQETGAHWREVVEGDLTPAFLTVRAALPAMIDRGRGAIVTMSSAAARQAARSSAAYAAAKAGVIAFTRHIAGEYAARGIRANCVAPSAIEHERLRQWTTEEVRRDLAASFPLRRIGRPEDVAQATLFLASDASSWITGVTLDVAGGKVMP
jgi:3-oxoacyl-[acyl-carrier protein] reductase